MRTRGEAKSSIGQLASVLRALDDDQLVRMLTLRNVRINGGSGLSIRDFFDLAESLLSPDSLQLCLTRLDRRTLNTIRQLGENRMATALPIGQLRDLGLLNESADGVAIWPEVCSQLDSWPTLGLPDIAADSPEPGFPLPKQSDRTIDPLVTEHAFNVTTTIAELLFNLEHEPLGLLGTGALGRPGVRRVAEILGRTETAVSTAIRFAETAGLVTRSARQLLPAESHESWLALAPAERWAQVAEAWTNTHLADVRAQLATRTFTPESDLAAWLHWNYPGGQDWLPAELATTLADAETLGLTASGTISSLGAVLLSEQQAEAESMLAAALPEPLDQLYLQHDLTAVATGPLRAQIDTRLRKMANVDGHTIASRYRFTTESVTRAIAAGETAATILEFLQNVSLSGIPQPLEYLVKETFTRHGLLRVGTLTTGNESAHSYLRSEDSVLLNSVLINRSLAALRLRPQDDMHLVSPCTPNQLFTALVEARYPVAVENSKRQLVAAQPKRVAAATAKAPVAKVRPDSTLNLVARLRDAESEAPENSTEAWLMRQFESAIRSKSALLVGVRMPNGNEVEYQLEPTSVSRGRLRARDTRSEIERTFPLSSITEVRRA